MHRLDPAVRQMVVAYAAWPLHLQAYRRQVYRCLCVPYEPADCPDRPDRQHPPSGPKLLGLVRWVCGAERYHQAGFLTVQRLITESFIRAERQRQRRGQRGTKKCPPS